VGFFLLKKMKDALPSHLASVNVCDDTDVAGMCQHLFVGGGHLCAMSAIPKQSGPRHQRCSAQPYHPPKLIKTTASLRFCCQNFDVFFLTLVASRVDLRWLWSLLQLD
jgi:hypothetical protein